MTKNRDFEKCPLNRGLPLNTGPLYTGSTLYSFTIQETLLKKKLSLRLSRVNVGPIWGRCTISEYNLQLLNSKGS